MCEDRLHGGIEAWRTGVALHIRKLLLCLVLSATLAAMALDSGRILVTGATGLIGRALVSSLKSGGVEVTSLVRGTPTGTDQIHWDPARPLASESVAGFDAIVHLAGESIASRWTSAKRARIRDSRVSGTRTLAHALAKAAKRPRVLVTSSAIGYYGDRGDEVLNEKSAPGSGFLADICREWEAANQPATDAGIRTVQIRTGIVLSAAGGALKKMLPPFRLGVGGRLGSGRQWMSWIHIQDMVGAIHHVIKTDLLQGPVNLVAPKPVTNAEFTETLASVLKRPAIFPVPALAIKTLFGEMGKDVLLSSQRVEPARLVNSGYPFHCSELRKALEAVLKG
jgi:uncharacterized protein